jgi:hypothetical protein
MKRDMRYSRRLSENVSRNRVAGERAGLRRTHARDFMTPTTRAARSNPTPRPDQGSGVLARASPQWPLGWPDRSVFRPARSARGRADGLAGDGMKIVILAGGFGSRLAEEPSGYRSAIIPFGQGRRSCSRERLTSDGQFASYRHQGLWKCRDLLRDRDSSRTTRAMADWK